MTPEEQNLITGLFERLRQADVSPKDPAAEELIRSRTAQLPSAPYLLSQAVLVQEHALANAQSRIAELERQVAAAGASTQSQGGFLSGVAHLFGGKQAGQPQPASPPPLPGQAQPPRQAAPPPIPMQQPPPYPSTVNLPPSSGGGFLRTAMATAAGVAGGSLLFQGIENLIGHNAGPFGSAIGNQGFGGQGGSPTEVIENNYYGGEPGSRSEQVADQDIQNADYDSTQDSNYDPADDQAFDDSSMDDGGGFDSGGDDSNLV
jgi:hypothetical protein